MSIPGGVWIETPEEAREWVKYLKKSWKKNNGLGVDTETTGISKVHDRVVVASISDGEDRVCFPAEYLPIFKELLEDPNIPLDLTNAKFDAHMLANSGVDISRPDRGVAPS